MKWDLISFYIGAVLRQGQIIRERNGRPTREFFNLLLSERSNGLDWNQTDVTELHTPCHTARADGDLTGLTRMFANIINTDPAYNF